MGGSAGESRLGTKKGSRAGNGLAIASSVGFVPKRGRAAGADWGPGSFEAGRRVARGCWCPSELGLRERLLIVSSLMAAFF